jgi:hypothetical protein
LNGADVQGDIITIAETYVFLFQIEGWMRHLVLFWRSGCEVRALKLSAEISPVTHASDGKILLEDSTSPDPETNK